MGTAPTLLLLNFVPPHSSHSCFNPLVHCWTAFNLARVDSDGGGMPSGKWWGEWDSHKDQVFSIDSPPIHTFLNAALTCGMKHTPGHTDTHTHTCTCVISVCSTSSSAGALLIACTKVYCCFILQTHYIIYSLTFTLWHLQHVTFSETIYKLILFNLHGRLWDREVQYVNLLVIAAWTGEYSTAFYILNMCGEMWFFCLSSVLTLFSHGGQQMLTCYKRPKTCKYKNTHVPKHMPLR